MRREQVILVIGLAMALCAESLAGAPASGARGRVRAEIRTVPPAVASRPDLRPARTTATTTANAMATNAMRRRSPPPRATPEQVQRTPPTRTASSIARTRQKARASGETTTASRSRAPRRLRVAPEGSRRRGPRRGEPTATAAGPAGPAGLFRAGAAYIFRAIRSSSGTQRLQAVRSLARGLQRLFSSGAATRLGMTAEVALGGASAIGVLGGSVQTSLGLAGVVRGAGAGDRRRVILGLLDLGAGAAWTVAAATGDPVAQATFLGLASLNLLYANAHRIVRLGRFLAMESRSGFAGVRAEIAGLPDRMTALRDRLADQRP